MENKPKVVLVEKTNYQEDNILKEITKANNQELWKHKEMQALLGGGLLRIQQQKNAGKYTARERLDILLDKESFEETDKLVSSQFLQTKTYTDGVITGFGKINGQKVAIYAQDFTILGGSVGKNHAQKICKIMDLAAKIGCPIIGIIDSGGARIEEGIHGLAGYGEIFLRNCRYSGVIPQISIILGPCAGGAVYSPALTDFIFTTDKISQMFITGPQVIEQVLHQFINKEDLGGALVHNQISGVAHFYSTCEEDCFNKVKKLLNYIPPNYLTQNKIFEQNNKNYNQKHNQEHNKINIEELIPTDINKAYDIKNIINAIFDQDSFFEVQKLFAENIVTGFATLDNIVCAIIANQPLVKAGSLDIDASCKAARFINFCDNFSIPIISLVDIPGFLPGIDQEHNGIIRHGAKLLYAYAQATTPKITLILRKAYGGAYIVMGSKHLAADLNYAWPQAQIAVMGAKGAISITQRKQISETQTLEEKNLLIQKLEKKYQEDYLNPFVAVEHGYIDAIIEPNSTRKHLSIALQLLQDKVEQLPKKKHGNIPL